MPFYTCHDAVFLFCAPLIVSCSYNEALNASIVYQDTPKAQYAPCQSWVGNKALEGAVGDIMATTPIGFYLTYQSPSGEGEGSSSSSTSHSSGGTANAGGASSGHAVAPHKSHRRLTSSSPSAAGNEHSISPEPSLVDSPGSNSPSHSPEPSPVDPYGSNSPTHSPEPSPTDAHSTSGPAHSPVDSPHTSSQTPHSTESETSTDASYVTNAISGVPVVVPEYTSGAPLALGLLLFDLFGNLLNMTEANSAGTVLVYSMDPGSSEQTTMTVRL